MTRTERLLRLARLRGDRAAELILTPVHKHYFTWIHRVGGLWAECLCGERQLMESWTEAELRAAWGDR